MANTKSAQKCIRQTKTRTDRNRIIRSELKTLQRNVDRAIKENDTEKLKGVATEYVSALDKACKRGIIHHNKVNRHKQAVSKYIFTEKK
ncbi:MAG: 30S ribosomal protein S20 [Verrucomicrobia bacterium GWC2_42_7]|nr:MAG: 30S ribosomal protein S20 [Verrucomicrobia bacterium GWC2_42_7]